MLSLLKFYILPPGAIIVALLLSLVALWQWRPRWARGACIALVLLLWALSTHRVATLLSDPLERAVPPAPPAQWQAAGAIVVLSGGRLFGQPQLNGGDDISAMALQRLANAARIKRLTGLPVLMSGGGGRRGSHNPPEGDLMATRFDDSFGLSTRWREIESGTTHENAVYSARLLAREDIGTVILVTNAWHMPRAARAFEAQGLKVLAAPTAYQARGGYGLRSFSPSVHALELSYWALHEYMGLVAGR